MRMRRLAKEILQWSLVRKKMTLGHTLILDKESPEQQAAIEQGEYETFVLDSLMKLLAPGAVVLDIGANIGFFSVPVARHCVAYGGHLHAFEPIGANFRRLKRNLAINRCARAVSLYDFALSDQPGMLFMRIQPEGGTNNALFETMAGAHDLETMDRRFWRREKVILHTLDDWADQTGIEKCDLIKIDVEGAELKVFEGGRRFLKCHRPIIFGEFSTYWMKQIGKNYRDIQEFFEPLGYCIYREYKNRFDKPESLPPIDLLATEMYLLVPAEAFPRVASLLSIV